MLRRNLIILMSSARGIVFAPAALLDSASVSDVVGTARVRGATGTPAWSLTANASGKYAIDASTGVVTVADTLTAGTDSITIRVADVTPALTDKTASIVVSADITSTAGEAIGLLLALTKAA